MPFVCDRDDRVRAALAGGRHNLVMRGFHSPRVAAVFRGRAKRLTSVTCMRRLLTILNAVVRQRTPWRAPVAA